MFEIDTHSLAVEIEGFVNEIETMILIVWLFLENEFEFPDKIPYFTSSAMEFT